MSPESPSFIIGTNYGRIFICPLFQESEGKVHPILLLDSHNHYSITNIFISYNSGLPGSTLSEDKSSSFREDEIKL